MQKRIWSEYNRKLVQRGSVTFMIHQKTVREIQKFKPKSKNGRPTKYLDALIELLLVVKIRFNLGYRALEGFARSVFQEINKWLKLHVALDEDTQEVVAESLTDSNISDSSVVEDLLDQINGKIDEVKADGAYDKQKCRTSIKKRGAKPIIPPPRNAKVRYDRAERDNAALEIMGLGNDERARSLWGKLTGYSRRVLVETFFSRYKRLFGGRLFSKTYERQRVENSLKLQILNAMITA